MQRLFTSEWNGGLSAFTGTGTIWFDLAEHHEGVHPCPQGLTCSLLTPALTVTVTYTYDPAPPSHVPEPASAALLLSGLGAAYALRRRYVEG